MIRILILVVALLLLAGPLRRRFFGAWRLTLPAAAGAVFGWVFASRAVASGAPRLLLLAGPVFAGLVLAGVCRELFDAVAGGPKKGG